MSGKKTVRAQSWAVTGCLVTLLVLLLLVMSPGAIQADVTREEIVRPWQDDILLCREALAEIARQANLRQKQIEELKAWHTRCLGAIAEAEERLKEENNRKVAAADRVVNGAQSLVLNDKGDAHIPGYGWGVVGTIAQHRIDTDKAIAETMKPVGEGTAQFHVAGLSWVTRDGLAAIIAADDKAIADLRAAVDAGSFQIYYPGMTWVSRTGLEGRIASNEKSIAETYAAIEAGTYQVYIPHLTWMSRNSMQKLIEDTEAEFKRLEASFSNGEVQIHRPLLSWFSLTQLHGLMDGIKKQIAEHQRSVAEMLFNDHIATYGWATGTAIGEAIKTVEKGIADVNASLAAGTYAVPLSTGGWANANQIREAYKQPNLKPEQRAALDKGMAHIPVAAGVDISLRELDLAKLRLYQAALARHATPLEERYTLELNQRANLQAEFDLELAAHKHRFDRRLAWLRECLAKYIPK